jgi:hypothetical protein
MIDVRRLADFLQTYNLSNETVNLVCDLASREGLPTPEKLQSLLPAFVIREYQRFVQGSVSLSPDTSQMSILNSKIVSLEKEIQHLRQEREQRTFDRLTQQIRELEAQALQRSQTPVVQQDTSRDLEYVKQKIRDDIEKTEALQRRLKEQTAVDLRLENIIEESRRKKNFSIVPTPSALKPSEPVSTPLPTTPPASQERIGWKKFLHIDDASTFEDCERDSLASKKLDEYIRLGCTRDFVKARAEEEGLLPKPALKKDEENDHE